MNNGTFVPQPGVFLASPQVGAGGTGANRVSWQPTLTISLPSATIAGNYTATIVHSVV